MKKLKFNSLEEFTIQYNLDKLNNKTLVISDIDGVIIDKMLSLRALLGLVPKKNLKFLEEILKTQCAVWFFTNRLSCYKHFPIRRQLSASVQKITNKSLGIYSNCADFLKGHLEKYIIIFNARKPKAKSQLVVAKGIRNYDKVIYFGAQDLPFYFSDEELVDKLDKQIDLSKVTFIDIRPK